MNEAKKPLGRPRKPAGEKYVTRLISFPPLLWARFVERVPARQRSSYLCRLLEKALNADSHEEPQQ